MVETDIADCFEAIPHEKLMQAVEERVCDQSVLKLLRGMLRAGVTSDGQVRRPVTGTPQGLTAVPAAREHLSAPARPGMERPRVRGSGALCR